MSNLRQERLFVTMSLIRAGGVTRYENSRDGRRQLARCAGCFYTAGENRSSRRAGVVSRGGDPSQIRLRLEEARVAAAFDFDLGRKCGEGIHFRRRELDVGRGNVLLDTVQLGGTRDRHDPGLPGE